MKKKRKWLIVGLLVPVVCLVTCCITSQLVDLSILFPKFPNPLGDLKSLPTIEAEMNGTSTALFMQFETDSPRFSVSTIEAEVGATSTALYKQLEGQIPTFSSSTLEAEMNATVAALATEQSLMLATMLETPEAP